MIFFKKVISIIIVLTMALLLVNPAFATTTDSFTYTAEAQKLNDLGLYKGISTTSFDPDLATALNRETGVVMLLRVFGLEQQASFLTVDEVNAELAKFTDAASISNWAKNAVAYASKNGLFDGYPDGTFGPKVALNSKAYATLILRQLGYTPDYNNAPAELADKGGLTPKEATKFASKELIKDDLVGISFGTLSASDKAGKTVIENLIDGGIVDVSAVVAAGFPYQPPTPPVVLPPQTIHNRNGGHHSPNPSSNISNLGNFSVDSLGNGSKSFNVFPANAIISISNNNQSVLSQVYVTGEGESRELIFNASINGTSDVTVTANCNGYKSLSKTITITVNDVPPTVVTPAQKTEISVGQPISITFSEPLNETSRNNVQETVYNGLTFYDNVILTYTWSENNEILTISKESGTEAVFQSSIFADITDMTGHTTANALLLDFPPQIENFTSSELEGNPSKIQIIQLNHPNAVSYRYELSNAIITTPVTGSVLERETYNCLPNTEIPLQNYKILRIYALDADNKVLAFTQREI